MRPGAYQEALEKSGGFTDQRRPTKVGPAESANRTGKSVDAYYNNCVTQGAVGVLFEYGIFSRQGHAIAALEKLA